MSEVIQGSINQPNDIKTHAIVAYILMVIGLFTAIPILIGAIWAMVKKKSSRNTVYHGHYVNATRSFWWSLFWTVIGIILTPIFIGYLVFAATWLWVLYRLVRGLAYITQDEAYPY